MYHTLSLFKLAIVFSLSLLVSACGGGGDDGIPGVDDFTPADGVLAYNGERRAAVMNTANANDYVRLLFSPGLNAPSTALRGESVNTITQPTATDFLLAQEKLLQRLTRQAVNQHLYAQRSVDANSPDDCDNGGNVRRSGELYDDVGKGRLRLDYSNCRVGDYILNGSALLLIYAINGSFDALSSSTLSYNGTQAYSVSTGETIFLTGHIDEVNDYNTGSVRTTSELHRRNSNSGQQTLVDVERLYSGGNDTVTMIGSLYEGVYGWARVNTIQPLAYDLNDNPISGHIVLTGINNSKVAVTALGRQYDNVEQRYVILFGLEVDADGDGFYESSREVAADRL